MNQPRHVATMPGKPVLLYDGDCHFCRLWVRRWQQCTDEAVDYVAFQDERVARLYAELPRERLETAVHSIDTDGAIHQGAEAVFRSLATNPSWRWPLHLYQRFSIVARLAERGYRFVAGHRFMSSWLTRMLWGNHVERADHFLVRRVFLSGLGAIYFIAFLSLGVQIVGLVGQNGILPAADLMSQAHSAVEASGTGIDRYHLLPTLGWFGTSDGFLRLQCAAGVTIALLLIAGIAPPVCLVLLWSLYLSLATIGREFLGFQWDNLLLETGWLAIFFAPLQLLPRPSREKPPSRTVLWLLRLLLFKLLFLSGVVKLTSGDETWRNLTALTHHYETQPLPNWIAWYAHQLPLGMQKVSCVAMFGIELVVPFFIFMPRRPRMAAGLALASLQVLILLTGNYTFFNWLTLALCLLLFDDFALAARLPRKLIALYAPPTAPRVAQLDHRRRWRLIVVAPVAAVIAGISIVQLLSPFGPLPPGFSPVVSAYRWLSPFRSLNSYGLFAVMTTERPEIIVEGSNDGRDWKAYEFLYKPGDLNRRPAPVAPHQPRLDWQMWFAALGQVRQHPWFVNFCIRLLQGSPDVLALLEKNPFPGQPPRYVRAQVYNYQFTSLAERERTGAWWKRELKGEYLPPISLEMMPPEARQPAKTSE